MYNLPKLFIEALQGNDQLDSQIRDEDVNLSQIKLRVRNYTWTDVSQTNVASPPRTVNITKNASAGPEAVGQVQTTNENQNFVRVTIEKGVVRGVNRLLKLPLDEKRPDLIAAFGRYVEIDPSKNFSEPIQNKMKIGVAVEGALGASGATATLSNKESQYRGNFTCKVVMEGKGLASDGIQWDIGGIIRILKDKPRRNNSDIKDLEVTEAKGKTVVTFTMEGELECKWDYEHTVEWK